MSTRQTLQIVAGERSEEIDIEQLRLADIAEVRRR